MKTTFTIFLLILFANVRAQRVRFSPPESQYPDVANYEIIGQINGHFLILLQGTEKSEIAVYDQDMNKIKSAPANFLKSRVLQKNFFTYPDHYLLFIQYAVDSTFYLSTLTCDGDGGVLESPTVMDSIVLPTKMIQTSNGKLWATNTYRPMFIVVRSENKQWFMILKGTEQEGEDQRLDATLLDKDLKPMEHTRIDYSRSPIPGEFSEFILDNDGDLAFIHSVMEDEESKKVIQSTLHIKQHGVDTLFSTELTVPNIILDDLNLRADNANHRYILNSLYYKWQSVNLTGLCSMIWEKGSKSLITKTLTPLSTDLLLEARSDFSPPEQVLKDYYMRQVFPFAGGGFLVLAELCYGSEKFRNYGQKRFDFIRGKGSVFFTPSYLSIPYANREMPGYWESRGRDRIGSGGAYGLGKNTDNLLVFMMDRNGMAQAIKVIHKSEFTTPGPETLSYQAFNDGKAIRLMYNEKVKGRWVPVGTTINIDGSIEPEPILHGLGNDQVLFPRYAKQVGLNTAIIPCQIGSHLCFARVDF